MAGFKRVKAGEWVTPVRRGYKMMCCDCRLVHTLNLRLVPSDHGAGKMIQLSAERDARATANARRGKKEK